MKESITKISITALLLIAMFGWLEKAQAGNSAGTLTRLSGKVAVLRRASQLMGDLNFERGSANLTPQAQSALSALANELKAKPTSKIRVEGYTDDVGDFNFNKQ
jgi:outer membrane protein OmpA-like peptidoglycan-associated protein